MAEQFRHIESQPAPLVSVITPVLNGRKYLEKCIESVLSQSYPHVEHVFVDGGSSDGTLDILTRYNRSYPQKVRFISGTDKTAEDAWNKGIILSKGDVLGWLGADDTYTPDALRTVVEFFRLNPGASFVFGICDVIDQNDQLMGQLGKKDFDLEEALNDRCETQIAAAFYKREVIAQVGLLDTSFAPSDFDFLIRVAKVFRLYRIDKVVSKFRMHPGSTSGSKGIERKYAKVTYKTSRRHGGRIFSRRFKEYRIQPVVDFLRPVFGPFYPWVRRLIHWSWS
jgi:glycosyltransferase involved in cell wall biosynthesis